MPNLGAPLNITLDDLESGINNEENSGFAFKRFSINQAGTDNIIIVDDGPVPISPIQLRRLVANTEDAANIEGNALHKKIFQQTGGAGGVVDLDQLSIENQLCYVAAFRESGLAVKPLQPPADGTTITKVGYPFTVQIADGDLVIGNARATWFGGPHDSQDSGATASGIVNTRSHPDYLGCALPMDEAHSASTAGSPIPRLRWGTLVEVTCRETGLKITVPLIDLGPARATGKALDLTEPAFEALGVPRGKGVMTVDLRVRDLAEVIHPQSHFDLGGVSTKKLVNGAGEKILPLPASADAATLGALISSLNLPNFAANEILGSLVRSRNGVVNTVPPPGLFTNIIPTLCLLQVLRDQLGCPLHPTSTYRSPEYNRAVGGAGHSQHLAFRAIDFQADGKSPGEVAKALRALRGQSIPIPMAFSVNQIDAAGMPFDGGALNIQLNPGGDTSHFTFHGGIGEYTDFVHVDCRGTDANWE